MQKTEERKLTVLERAERALQKRQESEAVAEPQPPKPDPRYPFLRRRET